MVSTVLGLFYVGAADLDIETFTYYTLVADETENVYIATVNLAGKVTNTALVNNDNILINTLVGLKMN